MRVIYRVADHENDEARSKEHRTKSANQCLSAGQRSPNDQGCSQQISLPSQSGGSAQDAYIPDRGYGENLLSDISKVAQAEARFQATQKRQQEGHQAKEQYEAEGRAIREKTERLRALRLAKEAAESTVVLAAEPLVQGGRRRTSK